MLFLYDSPRLAFTSTATINCIHWRLSQYNRVHRGNIQLECTKFRHFYLLLEVTWKFISQSEILNSSKIDTYQRFTLFEDTIIVNFVWQALHTRQMRITPQVTLYTMLGWTLPYSMQRHIQMRPSKEKKKKDKIKALSRTRFVWFQHIVFCLSLSQDERLRTAAYFRLLSHS